MPTYFQKTIFSLAFGMTVFLTACSKDEIQDDPEVAVKKEEVCELPVPESGCKTVFLQGERGWVKIVDPGELEDPYFLYASGLKKEPLGTVTVSKESSQLSIKINDIRVNSVVAEISQQASGFGSICNAEHNISPPSSDEDPNALVVISEEVTYPFYLKISANVCP